MATHKGTSFAKVGKESKALALTFIENYQKVEKVNLKPPKENQSFYIGIDEFEKILAEMKISKSDGIKISAGVKISKIDRRISEKSLQLILQPIIFDNADENIFTHLDASEVFYLSKARAQIEPPGVIVPTNGGHS